MKRPIPVVIAFAVFFLFFIQMAGTLVQSIYVLDLMNTSLDAKALGVLFFFAPVLLLLFRRKFPAWGVWILIAVLLICRGLTPSLSTQGRLVTAGVSVGCLLILLPFILIAKAKGETEAHMSFIVPAGLALAVGLSVFLRTLNYSLDYSLTPAGAWAGWLLCLALASALTRLEWASTTTDRVRAKGVTAAVMGIFLILTLIYFAFSAPAVIARWTQGNYASIVALVSFFSLSTAFLCLGLPAFIDLLSGRWLILWNVLFGLSLVTTILAHRVAFPASPESPAVVVGAPFWGQQIPLYLMLVLFPVVFLDLRLLFGHLRQVRPSPQDMIPGLLLGGLALVLLVFISIFTNVWGYIEPVSTPFRNMFWLPFLLLTAGLSIIIWRLRSPGPVLTPLTYKGLAGEWLSELAVIFAVTLFCALISPKVNPPDPHKTSLVVMTYNIQAGNDATAQRAYDRQLALIKKVSPDVVALQETDTARISMNNDDYVHYFAGKLGYYSYYGPTTVTGTFGTAILSKYPLQDTRSVFTYSDTDEIGTAEATIQVGDKVFSIHDVHPDGSPTAKLAFAHSLVDRSAGQANVIALGDYNLRAGQEAYQVVAARLTDAWMSLNPQATDPQWIDHIFVSPNLKVKDPTYLLPPQSASDHPAHWTEIHWE